MKTCWQDSHGALWQGDVRVCLAAMAPESVQLCVTSPPYWGLRAYGCEPQIWGGTDPYCDHQTGVYPEIGTTFADTPGLPPMTGGNGAASVGQVTNAGSQCGNAWREHWNGDGLHDSGSPADRYTPGGPLHRPDAGYARGGFKGATCTRCGAWRGELGSEPVHDCAGWATGAPCGQCFICHLVAVFEAVRRVLRPDGVCLVNLGDSYNNVGGGSSFNGPPGSKSGTQRAAHAGVQSIKHWTPGLKVKDLVGIPWRFALAMQAAGWWLRGDYVWSKPNPMPESVTDRCTRSHEYVFHFSKSATYFWDSDSIREANPRADEMWPSGGARKSQLANDADRNDWGRLITQNPAGRNARSVWEIPTQATPLAHFATFPQALVRRCIAAGTSERGACAVCGAPWERVTERTGGPPTGYQARIDAGIVRHHENGAAMGNTSDPQRPPHGFTPEYTTTGWAPTCQCDADLRPCVVLDPFLGSGTTAVVARAMGRYAVGIELNPEYLAMSLKRLRQGVLL